MTSRALFFSSAARGTAFQLCTLQSPCRVGRLPAFVFSAAPAPADARCRAPHQDAAIAVTGGSLSLARLVMPYAAWASAQTGLSGADSRLDFDAVTVPEQPEWGALSGTVTTGAAGEARTYTGNLQPTFVVNSGPCTVAEGGRCVGRWPGGYLPSEDCAISVAGTGGPLGPCPVFDTESYLFAGTYRDPTEDQTTGGPDFLTLPDGSTYHTADCPTGTVLAAGQTLAWHSDRNNQGITLHDKYGHGDGLPYSAYGAGGGWQICF